MRWRKHTERPPVIPVTAVIAVEDIDGERHLLTGIYTLTKHDALWWNEMDGAQLTEAMFWWMPEGELLKAIDDDVKRAALRELGAATRARKAAAQ